MTSKKAGKRLRAPSAFRPVSTGACEAQLWEFRGPVSEIGGEPPQTHKIAAASLHEALQYMARSHSDLSIISALLIEIIVLVSGSPLD
jgi:hypothetical protein